MAKVWIVYDSRTGNMEKMAKAVGQEARKADADVRLKKVDKAELRDLKWADGMVFGSLYYFGGMSAGMKEFIDSSTGLWEKGKLKNKVDAVFTSVDCKGYRRRDNSAIIDHGYV